MVIQYVTYGVTYWLGAYDHTIVVSIDLCSLATSRFNKGALVLIPRVHFLFLVCMYSELSSSQRRVNPALFSFSNDTEKGP